MSKLNRRSFLKSSALTVGAASVFAISGTSASGQILGANDRVRIAIAGAGGRGGELINEFGKLENVEIATQLSINPLSPEEVLDQVGLADRTQNFPAQLSGGEQQRVSIARALAKNPRLLLCDEPTGALDYATGKQILQLLQKTCRETGTTVIIITHNPAFEPIADRVVRMRSGKISKVTVNEEPKDVGDLDW